MAIREIMTSEGQYAKVYQYEQELILNKGASIVSNNSFVEPLYGILPTVEVLGVVKRYNKLCLIISGNVKYKDTNMTYNRGLQSSFGEMTGYDKIFIDLNTISGRVAKALYIRLFSRLESEVVM